MPNKYLSQVEIGEQLYYVKDAEARTAIAELSTYSKFLGVTTTELVDGKTTSAVITINGKDVTAKVGDIVIYGTKEFIYSSDNKWQEFGDLSALESQLGGFAYVNEGEVTVKEYADPSWTGTEVHFGFEGESLSSTGTFTATGTVSQPTFSGNALESTGTFTPAGTVSQPTFTGNALTSTGSVTAAGEVSKPDITVTPTTASVGLTAGTSPSLSGTAYSVSVDDSTETLSFSALTFNAGAFPALSGTTTFLTKASAALDNAPAFTGTPVDISVTGTPAGTVSQPTFAGTEGNLSVSGTPSGTVSQPTFAGTENQTITVSGTPTGAIKIGDEITASGNYTPAGSIAQGTATNVTKTVTPKSGS